MKLLFTLFLSLTTYFLYAQGEVIELGKETFKKKIDATKETFKLELVWPLTNTSKEYPEKIEGITNEKTYKDVTIRSLNNIPLPDGLELKIERLKTPNTKELGSQVKETRKRNGLYSVTFNLEPGLNVYEVKCLLNETILYQETIYFYRNVKPNLYILSIGIPYENVPGLDNLTLTTKDASELVRVIKETQGAVYGKIVSSVINTPNSTSSDSIIINIADFIGKSLREITRDDVFIFAISSHGATYQYTNDFIIPYSNFRARYSTERDNTSLKYSRLKEDFLEPLSSKCKLITIIDACHSGTAIGNLQMGSNNEAEEEANERIQSQIINQNPGAVTITSSFGKEKSFVNTIWGLSALAKGLSEALYDSKIDIDRNGEISIKELKEYLPKKVAELVRIDIGTHDRNGIQISQTPQFNIDNSFNEDYPLFKLGRR